MYGVAQHLKQKYMGAGHDSRSYDEDFQIAIDGKAAHGLPLTNFLNAQCTPPLP
jgi:hypothetical protein